MIKLYSESKEYKLYNGNMLDILDVIEENSIDAIITDPPYELGFMGKSWDKSGIAFQKETWEKCLKVLKPGGYLLAFGGSRTFARINVAIEDSGFEIRDTIMYLYGSGFPKGMNISKGLEAREKLGNAGTRNKRKIEQSCDTESFVIKQTNNGAMGELIETTRKKYVPDTELAKKWEGWNTQLKPAYEPIIVAQKPVEKSIIENVMKYGVGGINIDECRVDTNETIEVGRNGRKTKPMFNMGEINDKQREFQTNGRYPSNVIHDGSEEVIKDMPGSKSNGSLPNNEKSNCEYNGIYNFGGVKKYIHKSGYHFEDEGSVARYFYCAKASKFDRDEGLEEFKEKSVKVLNATKPENESKDDVSERFITVKRNIHPTVKPTELMKYLVRLVSPKGATILDVFNGSGSTGKAVMLENKERNANYKYIGIELSEEYCEISKARIEYIINNEFDFKKDENGRTQHEKVKKDDRLTIFDFEVEE